MSTEQNKAIVRGYMAEVLNRKSLAAFEDYFADDVVLDGKTGLRQQLEGTFNLFGHVLPDLQFIVEDQIAEGDKVVTRVTFRGTHTGAYQGMPPTGQQVTWTGVMIDRIVGGKVVEMWHWSDSLGMLRQLGAEVR